MAVALSWQGILGGGGGKDSQAGQYKGAGGGGGREHLFLCLEATLAGDLMVGLGGEGGATVHQRGRVVQNRVVVGWGCRKVLATLGPQKSRRQLLLQCDLPVGGRD